MKTTLIAAALLMSGMAGAQTASTDNLNFRLDGCAASGKKVLCSLTYFVTQADQARTILTSTKIFTNEGNQILPQVITLGGNVFGSVERGGSYPNIAAYKNIPVKIVIDTELPVTTTSIRAVVIVVNVNNSSNETVRFDNIPVRSASVTMPVQIPTVVTTGLYDVQLRNCKSVTNGGYTCTSATVTPRK